MNSEIDRRRVSVACAAPGVPSLGRVRARLLGGASSLALPVASAVLALGVALSGEARAQSSFNGNHPATYTLTSGGTQTSPFTFGSAAVVGSAAPTTDAVVGDTGTNWNVINNGRLTGDRYGIYLQTPGGNSVTNTGTITGTTGQGVYFTAGGNLTNQTGGKIIGGSNGVLIKNAAGTVINAGTIVATYYGVILAAGGSVTNQTGATISGQSGVRVINAAGTVINAGTITATYRYGVLLAAGGTVTNSGTISGFNEEGVPILGGGSVTNQAGGRISGDNGVYVRGGAGTVTNAGTITGTTGGGVILGGGGGVTNQAGGTITGVDGIIISGTGSRVTNAGTVAGTNRNGVLLGVSVTVTNQAGGTITGALNGIRFASGSVTNQAGGMISGGQRGIYVDFGAGTVTNAGTITGGTASVQFGGTGANVLTLQTGSVLSGDAVGSTLGTNALILQGTGAANNNFLNFTTLNVLAGGIWALNGVSTIGTTTIDSGILAVGDAAHPGAQLTSPVSVNAGGTLAGQGTVIGNVLVAGGGAIAPGAASPFTTLHVTGNANFANGSFYNVNVNGAGQSDKLALSGTATLTGGSVLATLAPGSFAKQSYDILHVTSGLGGTIFSGVSMQNFAASLSYTPTDVLLNVNAATLGAGSGLNGNQQNVANSINTFFNSGGTLPAGFVTLFGLSGGNLGNALSQISGEASTGGQQVAFQMMTGFLNVMIDPSIDGRGGFGGGGATPFAPERAALPEDIALAYAKVMKAPPYRAQDFDQRWSAWGSAFGGAHRTSGDPAVVGSHDLSASVGGVAAGFDYHLTRDTLIGFALAGGGTNWSLAQGLGGGKSDAFQFGIYAKTHSGPAYLAASLAYAEHWMSTDRIAFAGDHLTSSFNAQSFGGRLEGGYRFATPYVGITPYAALQVQAFHTPTYSETDQTGGGLGLGFASRNATDTRSELGSRFDKQMVVSPDAVLTLRGRLAWAHDWVSDPSLMATFQALPGASFIVSGATPAKDSALASAGAELRFRSGWSLMAKFDGEFASRAQTYAGTGTLRYSW